MGRVRTPVDPRKARCCSTHHKPRAPMVRGKVEAGEFGSWPTYTGKQQQWKPLFWTRQKVRAHTQGCPPTATHASWHVHTHTHTEEQRIKTGFLESLWSSSLVSVLLWNACLYLLSIFLIFYVKCC